MAQDSKVFDVASPGKAKPETGSKPMVVGHKIMQDPSIKTSDTEETPTETLSSRGEKTIKPLSQTKPKEPVTEELEVDVTVADDSTSSVIATDKTPESENEMPEEPATESAVPETPEESPAVAEESEPEVAEQTAEEKQKTEDSLEVEREEKLQEMIKSKEYYAPIQEASLSSMKTFFKTFIVVAFIGIIALVILIDMEILDLGVTLPFDFL